jgi:hypothetical protein
MNVGYIVEERENKTKVRRELFSFIPKYFDLNRNIYVFMVFVLG